MVTDLENIYINEQTKELQFIYFPIFDANETDFIKVMYDIIYLVGPIKNYVVNDNSAVSRSHADIIKRDNRYYVMDLNSTNKTYLNGVTLAKKEETELKDGDVIKLANEEFVFSID